MSKLHRTIETSPWESALWGLMGLNVTVTGSGHVIRTVMMPTMHAWPVVGAGWLALAAVGVPQSWLAYCLVTLAGLLLTEYTDARARLKESDVTRTSQWREVGTWVSLAASVGYHAYQVLGVHDLAAVKPLGCSSGLLVLWFVKYVAHHVQRALRLFAEICAKLDTIQDGTTDPDPDPEPLVRGQEIAVVVRLDDRRARKHRKPHGRHRKAA
ncbi:hypothetical protein [Amycolatopsis sp. MtRt-6]|uniref:hypothetical protein n=1 Tax=Amycolatopsis sp. MtRt-6 TaxID=2792782 RepID=UPI001A8D6181|nr:hypothetical protein [Amycolatopsis sp. MtRt-6]